MSNLDEYALTIIKIDDEYHLYDLITKEIYPSMSLDYIQELLDKWNKQHKSRQRYAIIKIII
ncbi:hypothetical protein [Thomasclavelia sp.]|uniref:hypothetical protein n=1 Tax=Thomasclavelia sp. TaxID=3025757 RepID=UPI0025E3FF26|nr:hypothetical protein [Thomasclavelia sp.]